jgi:rRNA maturation RNase YbeY
MNIVDVQVLQEKLKIDARRAKRWAEETLKILGHRDSELSVVLVDDQYIQQLNKHYLGRDKPTNVIAFPQQEGERPRGGHLGDIVISLERADAEAKDAEMTFEERLMELLVHGICHLCGYDHESEGEAQAREMEHLEREIQQQLGNG